MVVKVIDFSQASPSPLNPVSAKVRQFIFDELHDGLRDPRVTSMVLTGGLHNFSAGADLTEFGSISAGFSLVNKTKGSSGSGQLMLTDVVLALEDSVKPIVAAIAGACLGGGCELALACHYRVAVDSTSTKTKLGLPEVHVGVIPGAGGTQRLPKAIGLASATQLILTGSSLSAKEAHKQKLVDDVVSNSRDLLDKAKQWASWAEVMPLTDRRLGRKTLMEIPAVAHNVLQQAELSLPRYGTVGYKAALEAIRASFLPLEQGMAVEGEAFAKTLLSEQGKARRHGFFAVRQAQKHVYPHLAKKQEGHPLLKQIKSGEEPALVAVIGAGTMGTGIAVVLLQAGFRVILVDIQEQALQKGMTNIKDIFGSQVRRKKLKAPVAKSLLNLLASTTRLEDLKNCQLVVEAVVENLRIKQNIFRSLDQITPPSSILLSNTSTLDIDAIASVLQPQRKQWFLGWHFFSPANVMQLVEVVRGSQTSPDAIALLQTLSKKVGKIGVVVGNCDGFCGNRLLRPYQLESTFMLEEGVATIAQVDQAIVEFGFALGPFQMGDLAGNDVGYNIRKERGWVVDPNSSTTKIPSNRPARYARFADVMVSEYGRIGQKAGKGWYDYDPSIGKGRTPLHSKEMDSILQSHTKVSEQPHGMKMSSDEIVCGCLYPLVNEGFKCLEEGIAIRPSDIDVVYLYGYGWPAWRGGPMHWADHQVGLHNILSWLQRMARDHPTSDQFAPSRLLVECVQKGITVEELWQQRQTLSLTTRSKL